MGAPIPIQVFFMIVNFALSLYFLKQERHYISLFAMFSSGHAFGLICKFAEAS